MMIVPRMAANIDPTVSWFLLVICTGVARGGNYVTHANLKTRRQIQE